MTDAPERIWAWQYRDENNHTLDLGEWYTEDIGLDGDETEYIRADVVEDMVASRHLTYDFHKEMEDYFNDRNNTPTMPI